MHNVHSCVMGGSKWDSSRSLLFCFNDLLFHLVLKIRMEDLFRFIFSFRKCTCWQSIPLGYDLECVTSSTAKLLNSSFNKNGIPHLPLEHFPPALPYWCCTSCFCGEREKKGMNEKIKWMSRDQCQRFDQHHVSNLSLILTLCDLKYKWWVVHFSFNTKTSVVQFIS